MALSIKLLTRTRNSFFIAIQAAFSITFEGNLYVFARCQNNKSRHRGTYKFVKSYRLKSRKCFNGHTARGDQKLACQMDRAWSIPSDSLWIASWRSFSDCARVKTSNCNLMAVSGVRSSCAASAVNCRCSRASFFPIFKIRGHSEPRRLVEFFLWYVRRNRQRVHFICIPTGDCSGERSERR